MTVYPEAVPNKLGGHDFICPGICDLICIQTAAECMTVHQCYFLDIKNDMPNGACYCSHSGKQLEITGGQDSIL